MKRFKQEKGITLIALIVTIIVLIILALISMNAIFGEDGIIKRAEKAKEEYEKAKALEEMKLELLGMRMDEILTGENSSDLIEKLGIKGIEKIEEENGEETYYYITEKDGVYYRTVMKDSSVLSMEEVDKLTDEAILLLKLEIRDFSELTELADLSFKYNDIRYICLSEKIENKTVTYVEKFIGIEKIEIKSGSQTNFYVTEKEDGYYRKTITNVVTATEKLDTYSRLDEAEAFFSYSLQAFEGMDVGVTMISDTQFEYKDIIYNICQETVDSTTVMYVEKGKEILPIKMIVNSGEDGIVVLPVDVNEVTSVDWGDGNIETALSHEYAEKNKEYEVTINGAIWLIDAYSISEACANKIIEITQWGTTGLEEVYLSGCTNLRKIASPNEDSFINVISFEKAFSSCTSLTEIPSDLFSNCPNVTSFRRTFRSCTSLTEIPSDLFSNCPNVSSFSSTFEGCTNLTGNAPELWTLGTNSESNSYMGEPNGSGCFAECTGLTNYENIPDYWKQTK